MNEQVLCQWVPLTQQCSSTQVGTPRVAKTTHSFKGVHHITLQSNSAQVLGVQTPEMFWTSPDQHLPAKWLCVCVCFHAHRTHLSVYPKREAQRQYFQKTS